MQMESMEWRWRVEMEWRCQAARDDPLLQVVPPLQWHPDGQDSGSVPGRQTEGAQRRLRHLYRVPTVGLTVLSEFSGTFVRELTVGENVWSEFLDAFVRERSRGLNVSSSATLSGSSPRA